MAMTGALAVQMPMWWNDESLDIHSSKAGRFQANVSAPDRKVEVAEIRLFGHVTLLAPTRKEYSYRARDI